MAFQHEGTSVLAPKFGAGPHGVGDPNDKSLRKVEIEVMIPKKMRDVAKREKCPEQVLAFSECCKEHNILMVAVCRKENSALKSCLTRWYNDEEFKRRCTREYLEDRSEYRRTGVSHKRGGRVPSSM